MTQICEYCRSHVGYGRYECKNCGATVRQFRPEYNTYNSPYFVHDDGLGNGNVAASSFLDPTGYWAQAQNILHNDLYARSRPQQLSYPQYTIGALIKIIEGR